MLVKLWTCAVALGGVVALSGCGYRLPFSMGPEKTPHEIRAQHGESAMYASKPEETAARARPNAAAQRPAGLPGETGEKLAPWTAVPLASRAPAASGTGSTSSGSSPQASRYGDLLF